MARAKSRPVASAAPAGGMSSGTKAMVVIAIVMVVPFSLPTFILLFTTMMPTLVAALTDRAKHRYAWLSVGGVNFAGVAPWLFDLWFGVHTMEEAFNLATSVSTLMSAYMAAGFGYILHMACPPVAGAILQMNHQRRVGHLRDEQKNLIEQWGADVAEADDDDDY